MTQQFEQMRGEITPVAVVASDSGYTEIVAGVAGCRIRVVSGYIVTEGAVTVRILDGDENYLSGPMVFSNDSGGGIAWQHNPHGWFLPTATGYGLGINLSAGVVVGGNINYVIEQMGTP